MIGAACRLDRCNLLLVAAVILGTRCELLLQIFLEVIVAIALHRSDGAQRRCVIILFIWCVVGGGGQWVWLRCGDEDGDARG